MCTGYTALKFEELYVPVLSVSTYIVLLRQEPFPRFAVNGMLGFGVHSSAFLYGLGV